MSGLAHMVTDLPSATRSEGRSMFRPEFEDLDDAALLAHFHGREGVEYFPVPDEEETRPEKIEAVMKNRFRFNGETHLLPHPVAWTENPSADVEWHILLHKFYYAPGLGLAWRRSGERRYLEQWVALTQSWIAATPVGFIAADVTGRRVQNWIYAYYYFVTHATVCQVPADFHRRLLESIHEQVEFLCANLTPARNHRTLELYAIFLAGIVFPEMARAQHWRDFALAEIVHNMASDLLPDGVQCELSTDYHHLVLKNYLCVRRLAQLNDVAVPPAMDERLLRALEFSLHAHKPDGIVPSLSDGDARGFPELLAQGYELYGRRDMLYVASRGQRGEAPARRSAHFPHGGYTILRSGWGGAEERYEDAHYLIFDCGPLGAGNHGHFDCLSFELAAHGRSLVVDPGRYTYSEAGEVNWRVRFRGTASHNTVTVDGMNQTRYLPKAIKEPSRHAHGSVRHKVAGPAPEAELRTMLCGSGFDFLHGIARSHEYDAVHERRILHVRGEYWVVCDWLHGVEEHDFDLRFQLSEQAQGRVEAQSDEETLRFLSPGLLLAQPAAGAVAAHVEPGHVSYRYGEKHPAPLLRFRRHGSTAAFLTVLYPFRGTPPRLRVEALALAGDRAEAQARADRFAVHVETGEQRHTDHILFADAAHGLQSELGGVTGRGSFLFVRRDGAGQLVRVHHDPHATVRIGS